MSFLATLETDFEKIGAIFVSFFKKVPSWTQIAETDLAFIAPVINSLVTLTSGSAADAVVSQILTTVQNDLVLATKFIQATDSSANLVDVLNSIKANLQGLLAIAEVKSSSSVTQITAYVNAIIGELEAIINSLPKSA